MHPGLAKIHTFVKAELRRFISFGIIGVCSLGLTVGGYALLSRVLWQSGSHTVEYALVVIVVTWLNYEANSRFTFGAAQRNAAALGRFACVAVVALGLNTSIFWLGHDVFHLSDLLVIIGSTLIVALFTFSSHKLFTFHERPWRHVEKFRRKRAA